MKIIQDHIISKQAELAGHEFFHLLKSLNTLERFNDFIPELTFWVMTFQDILRINEERIIDPYLKKIARHHRLEDANHDKWFLHDIKYIAKFGTKAQNTDTVEWLYRKEFNYIREASYEIISTIYHLEHEYLNIILLLILESSGHVFFEKIVAQVILLNEDQNLQYFSSFHLNVEKAHELFEQEMEKNLFQIQLPENIKRQGLALVDSAYLSFHKIFDGLANACKKQKTHGVNEEITRIPAGVTA